MHSGRLMISKTRFLTVLFFISLTLIFMTTDLSAIDFWDQEIPEKELVRLLLEKMRDEDLLGQVFLFWYSGNHPSKEIIQWITTRNMGGVKIFGWNTGDLRVLSMSIGLLQNAALSTPFRIPLFVATDQEGGWVRHVKSDTSITPGNLSIGASGLPEDAYLTGKIIGYELRIIGINMNFAPTVDVYTNPDAHVIGPRAFSDDPVQTGILALAYYQGMKEQGIICTAKHFPGHGGAPGDSHGTLPIAHTTSEELWERDLVPYRFLIKEGLPAIMSGHIAYPEITGETIPASLSPYFQSVLIRDRLHFQGVLVTDDLRMQGALEAGIGVREIAESALRAGNDMIMLSRNMDIYQEIWDYLLLLIKNDESFRNRILEAVGRILTVKLAYLRGENAVPIIPDPELVASSLPSEHNGFFLEQAARAVTLIQEERIPLTDIEGKKILLAGQLKGFLREGQRRLPGADTFYFSYSPFYTPRQGEIDELKNIQGNYDIIIFCLANPNSLAVLKTLKESPEKVIVLSTLTPVYLREVPWVSSALAVYGTGKESYEAGFAALLGDFIPEGTLPISLELE